MTSNTPIAAVNKVSFKDWFLALICLLFTLGGLLVIQDDFNVGITTLALFGTCFVTSARGVLRKLRLKNQHPLTVRVVGGQPIQQSRGRITMLGLGLLAVGVVLLYFQPEFNWIFSACALLMSITGGALLIGAATGRLAKAYIQFDPEGLTLGHFGGKTILPWSAITHIEHRELYRNPVLCIWSRLEEIRAEPSTHMAKIYKQVGSSRALVGADFLIFSANYALDAPILLAAIQRYASTPEARAELESSEKLKSPA